METAVSDDHWLLIKKALENPDWDFRTLDGLAKETGLSREEIRALLDDHQDDTRKSYVTDRSGNVLYAPADKPVSLREILANIRAFVTKTT